MICRKCGRENLDGSQSCAYCGTSMQPSLPKEPSAPSEPGLNELPSGGSLSAAMISDVKAESAIKGGDVAGSGAAGNGAAANSPQPVKNGRAAGRAGSARGPASLKGQASAGTAGTAGTASAAAPYARPLSGQMPYVRQPVPASATARPQPVSGEGDDPSEVPPISAKTRRKIMIGFACFLGLIIFSSVLDQCASLFSIAASFIDPGSQSSISTDSEPSGPDSDTAAQDWVDNYSSGADKDVGKDSGKDVGSSPKTPAARSVEEYVDELDNPRTVVSDKDIEIVIDIGSGKNELTGYYTIDCIIENGTDDTIGLLFRFVSANGFSGGKSKAHFFNAEAPPETRSAFEPGKNKGYLSFAEEGVSGDIANLSGMILVYDHKTGKNIGEYPISITEL